MYLIITKQWKLFTVCTEQVRSPYIEHAASGLPTLLAWRGRYDLSSLKTSRFYHTLSENGNRVLKCINLPFQGMCLYMYIVLTVSQFHTDVHLVYLVFCLTRQFYQKSWVWVIYSDETSNQAKAKSLSNFTLPYSLLICSISACSQHQYLLPWLTFSCVYHLTCRKKEQKKERIVLQ